MQSLKTHDRRLSYTLLTTPVSAGLYDMVAKLERRVSSPQKVCFVVVSGSGCDIKMGTTDDWVSLLLLSIGMLYHRSNCRDQGFSSMINLFDAGGVSEEGQGR